MPVRHSRGKIRREHPVSWVFLALGVALLIITGIAYGSASLTTNFSDRVVRQLADGRPSPTATSQPVQQVALELSPAANFINQIKSFVPEGYPAPSAQAGGSASSPLAWTCGIALTPAPALGVELDLANGATVVVQAFGAGQSAKALDSYRQSIANCARREGSGGISSRSSALDGTQGFVAYALTSGVRQTANVWVRGDVMITVSSSDVGVTNDISGKYDAAVSSALTATTCISPDVNAADSTRSPYYDINTYTGWQRGREVTLGDNVPTIKPGVLSSSVEVKGSGDHLGILSPGSSVPSGETLAVPKTVKLPQQPEAPSDPASLPAPVAAPGAAPAIPTVAPVSVVIPERVRDEAGPGCGWAWTGQAAPVYDDTVEKQRADKDQITAQENLRTGYAAYLTNRSGYLDTYLTYSASVSAYAQYADQVNQIAAQWDHVNSERSKYRHSLDDYYAAIAVRDKFIVDQQSAQTSYDSLVQQCAAQVVTTAPSLPQSLPTQNPTPVPTPVPTPTPTLTPTPTPTVPTLQCPPTRPEILDQKVPTQPVPPVKPDVPLPASWTDVP